MSSFLNDLNSEQLIILGGTLSLSFSKGLTPSEIEILGGLFTIVGDSLSLIASKHNRALQNKLNLIHNIDLDNL